MAHIATVRHLLISIRRAGSSGAELAPTDPELAAALRYVVDRGLAAADASGITYRITADGAHFLNADLRG